MKNNNDYKFLAENFNKILNLQCALNNLKGDFKTWLTDTGTGFFTEKGCQDKFSKKQPKSEFNSSNKPDDESLYLTSYWTLKNDKLFDRLYLGIEFLICYQIGEFYGFSAYAGLVLKNKEKKRLVDIEKYFRKEIIDNIKGNIDYNGSVDSGWGNEIWIYYGDNYDGQLERAPKNLEELKQQLFTLGNEVIRLADKYNKRVK